MRQEGVERARESSKPKIISLIFQKLGFRSTEFFLGLSLESSNFMN